MRRKQCFSCIFLFCGSLLIWMPIWMIIEGSFMGSSEISSYLGQVLNDSDQYASWSLLPVYPTLKTFVELLLDSPSFFSMFWNSCNQVIPGVLGQIIVSVPAAWSFARYNFKGKKVLFMIYIILMIMPFQVTMVSSYLILDKFHLMDTNWALIIPNIFSTFPVFIMTKFFHSIPKSLVEAAKIDGAGEIKVFLYIGIPLGSSGIISAIVLGFIEQWNSIEQPLTFLKDKSLWPLSLYLPEIAVEKLSVAMLASLVTMTPALLIFLYGQKYLEQGIIASGIKE